MIVARTRSELRRARCGLTDPTGLVPTMGALHAGHIALLRAARERERSVVATLFVNRAQFDDPNDFAAYPRDENVDLNVFEECGVDIVFVPNEAELYPNGLSSRIDAGPVAHGLEGVRRPGHFDGVAMVVAKLLYLAKPTCAYFGQKDWQQTRVIAQMVNDLDLEVDLVTVSTVRDANGLALSSRNALLVCNEFEAAQSLFRGLSSARYAWVQGERSPTTLLALVRAEVAMEPMVTVVYADVRHALTLAQMESVDVPFVIALAAEIGGVCLIDNIVVGEDLIDVELDPR